MKTRSSQIRVNWSVARLYAIIKKEEQNKSDVHVFFQLLFDLIKFSNSFLIIWLKKLVQILWWPLTLQNWGLNSVAMYWFIYTFKQNFCAHSIMNLTLEANIWDLRWVYIIQNFRILQLVIVKTAEWQDRPYSSIQNPIGRNGVGLFQFIAILGTTTILIPPLNENYIVNLSLPLLCEVLYRGTRWLLRVPEAR